MTIEEIRKDSNLSILLTEFERVQKQKNLLPEVKFNEQQLFDFEESWKDAYFDLILALQKKINLDQIRIILDEIYALCDNEKSTI